MVVVVVRIVRFSEFSLPIALVFGLLSSFRFFLCLLSIHAIFGARVRDKNSLLSQRILTNRWVFLNGVDCGFSFQCCVTSTKAIRLLDGHLNFHTAPELWLTLIWSAYSYRSLLTVWTTESPACEKANRAMGSWLWAGCFQQWLSYFHHWLQWLFARSFLTNILNAVQYNKIQCIDS